MNDPTFGRSAIGETIQPVHQQKKRVSTYATSQNKSKVKTLTKCMYCRKAHFIKRV